MKRMLGVAALWLAMSSPALAETMIRYSNWLPVKHQLHADVMAPWMAEVEKVTQGRVKFEILPKLVGTVPTQFDVVRDGLADMAIFVPGFSPGRFELMEVTELPLMADEPLIMAPAANALYVKHLARYNEFKGVHIASMFSTAAGHIYTAKKPMRSLADLKGLKLRTSLASNAPAMIALGTVPIQKGTNEIYELVTSGVVDGTLWTKEGPAGFSMVNGTLNHMLVVPGGLYNSILSLAINEEKWKAIEPRDREAIDKLSGDALAKAVGEAYSRADERGFQMMKAAGATIVTADGAFLASIRQVLQPAEATWIAKAKKKGMANPEAVLADFKADIAARQKALGSAR
ncbi:TRAP transporter substrate-binding protein [Variovorax sp. KK3]|uniref:TRAP transporter substrate-binding protein n=1 Tax=Variovorax sp. KK3 TaxID=1855728 RepID=UPI00097C3FCA|nr:TRAP transporter substrate-binding protein [Variovorax sp. KK3]